MDTASFAFTALFCALLVLGLVIRTVLASRQIRHVARHRGTVPTAFSATISMAAHQKAADYTITKTRFGMLEIAIDAALLLAWTLLGGLNWLNQTLLAAMGGGMAQQLALLGSFAVIGGLITLPLGWYATFRIEERFGFNKMTASLWLGDLLKGTLVGALVGLPIAALVLWLMGAAGPAWWLWAWGAWMVFNLLALVLYPTVIAPLFNKFEPLADETLKTRVNALMQRCGFAAKGLFVMDGSKRSAHANAYFTGFGAAKRVVFFDTLLKQLSPEEIDAVLAHELGHYKRRHIIKRIVLMFTLSLAGFALLGWVSSQAWFYSGLGVMPSLDTPNDALALILFMMVVPLFTLFLSPLMAQLSRKHEFEADAYAVEHTNGSDLASALLKLYKDNASTLTPDPVYARFYYSHPPASERLSRLQAAA
jgi:STE24 endopeptidase